MALAIGNIEEVVKGLVAERAIVEGIASEAVTHRAVHTQFRTVIQEVLVGSIALATVVQGGTDYALEQGACDTDCLVGWLQEIVNTGVAVVAGGAVHAAVQAGDQRVRALDAVPARCVDCMEPVRTDLAGVGVQGVIEAAQEGAGTCLALGG